MAFGLGGGASQVSWQWGVQRLAPLAAVGHHRQATTFPHRPSRGGQPARDATTNHKTLEKHENMNNFGLEEAKSDTL